MANGTFSSKTPSTATCGGRLPSKTFGNGTREPSDCRQKSGRNMTRGEKEERKEENQKEAEEKEEEKERKAEQ